MTVAMMVVMMAMVTVPSAVMMVAMSPTPPATTAATTAPTRPDVEVDAGVPAATTPPAATATMGLCRLRGRSQRQACSRDTYRAQTHAADRTGSIDDNHRHHGDSRRDALTDVADE